MGRVPELPAGSLLAFAGAGMPATCLTIRCARAHGWAEVGAGGLELVIDEVSKVVIHVALDSLQLQLAVDIARPKWTVSQQRAKQTTTQTPK